MNTMVLFQAGIHRVMWRGPRWVTAGAVALPGLVWGQDNSSVSILNNRMPTSKQANIKKPPLPPKQNRPPPKKKKKRNEKYNKQTKNHIVLNTSGGGGGNTTPAALRRIRLCISMDKIWRQNDLTIRIMTRISHEKA